VGLESALDYLGKVGMDEVRSHDLALCEYAMRRMAEIPSVTIHGPADLEDRGGVLSFTMGDIHPHDIATILDQGGVSVRAGHHCAKPLHRTLGRVATARASFNVYNDRADIDALITGLHKAGELFGVS
jgi:cysteine desulfurase/selenocysteine lyase